MGGVSTLRNTHIQAGGTHSGQCLEGSINTRVYLAAVARVDVVRPGTPGRDLEPRVFLEQVSTHTDEAEDAQPDIRPRELRDEVLLPGTVAHRRLLLQTAPPLVEEPHDVHELFELGVVGRRNVARFLVKAVPARVLRPAEVSCCCIHRCGTTGYDKPQSEQSLLDLVGNVLS